MPMDKTITTREHGVLVGVLRELRLTAGLRQSDVAERLDVHQSFVSKYESGERRLDLVEREADRFTFSECSPRVPSGHAVQHAGGV